MAGSNSGIGAPPSSAGLQMAEGKAVFGAVRTLRISVDRLGRSAAADRGYRLLLLLPCQLRARRCRARRSRRVAEENTTKILDTHLLAAGRIDDLLRGLSDAEILGAGEFAARANGEADRECATDRGGLGNRREWARAGQCASLPGRPGTRSFRARGLPGAAGTGNANVHLGAACAQPGNRKFPTILYREPASRGAEWKLRRDHRHRRFRRLFRLVLSRASWWFLGIRGERPARRWDRVGPLSGNRRHVGSGAGRRIDRCDSGARPARHSRERLSLRRVRHRRGVQAAGLLPGLCCDRANESVHPARMARIDRSATP